MGEMDLAEAAAQYLNAGLPVIALSGKSPNGVFHRTWSVDTAITGTLADHGDHPADSYGYDGCPGCDDRKLLREVFEHKDTTGIGLPIPAHLVVVDIDGEDGAKQFADLVGSDAVIPDTAVARTGRGLHLWFATPNVHGNRKLGPKLDLKGFGGYVAAPPSRHPDGHLYEWLDPLVIDGRITLDWLPQPIEDLLGRLDTIKDEFAVDHPVYTLYQLSLDAGAWRLHTEPAPPPIDGLVKTVRDAAEGNRNSTLAWSVLQARDEGVTLEVAMRELGGAATEAGLTALEIRTTIRSAYRRRRRQ